MSHEITVKLGELSYLIQEVVTLHAYKVPGSVGTQLHT